MDNSRFKFRVWDKTNKQFRTEYVDSDLYLSLDGKTLLADFPEYGCPIDKDMFEWEIQQCTGLKDCAGNLIFEGDILHAWTTYEDDNYSDAINSENITMSKIVVEWGEFQNCGCCGYIGGSGFDIQHVSDKYEKFKIIGNIFEGISNED